MDVQTKLNLVKKGHIIEILTEEELIELFNSNPHPKHYIGFEVSGKVHIATGLLTALKIKDFIKAGIKPTIFLSDYHAWINQKLGGDLDLIQKVAKKYFKVAFNSLGLEDNQVEFVLASELYAKLGNDYWKEVLEIAKDTTLNRMLRCTTIMGRSEKENLQASAIIYPAMQVADMWALDVDIAHAGMDQRKVHVLARELAPKYKRKKIIAVHGRLILGLSGIKKMDSNLTKEEQILANKMSKSDPDSCIFIHDSKEEIKRKISKANCPPKIVENNPIIDYIEVFILRDKPFLIERDAKYGGDVEYTSIKDLKKDYIEGKIHPLDLKNALYNNLVELLEPSIKYFEKNKELLEIFDKV
jgi:tyrosyl-tRNA synthetase